MDTKRWLGFKFRISAGSVETKKEDPLKVRTFDTGSNLGYEIQEVKSSFEVAVP